MTCGAARAAAHALPAALLITPRQLGRRGASQLLSFADDTGDASALIIVLVSNWGAVYVATYTVPNERCADEIDDKLTSHLLLQARGFAGDRPE